MTELLDAVDALTKPVVNHFPQVGDDGKWLRAHTVQLPSLLEQLEAAIVSSTSGRAGGGQPSTRAVLNSSALFEFMRITSAIRDWCGIEKVRAGGDAGSNLRRWYVAYVVTPKPHEWHTRELHSWAGTIRAQLDPPRRLPVTAACVVCGATQWVDSDGAPQPYPVVIEYRDGDPDILASATAMCRSCERVWRGSLELRELRFQIDAAEAG